MATIVENPWDIVDRNRERKCTLGFHPPACGCGSFVDQQCCCAARAYDCRLHKCGPRVGCRCPVPEIGKTPGATAQVVEAAG
jgi:hypothetical protein